MAQLKATAATAAAAIDSKEILRLLPERNNLLLNISLGIVKPQSITHWEEITCIGYNPYMQRLEAIVSIKQSTGYGGNLCSKATKENVRFYVDFHNGSGFEDMGLASFKSADISDVPPGAQHPLAYMVYLNIDDRKHRRFTDCTHAVIPKMRAILSWNVEPTPNTPNYPPHYGNVKDADIQILKRPFIFIKDVVDASKLKDYGALLKPEFQIPIPDPGPLKLAELYEFNKKAGVPDHRTFFSAVGASIQSPMNFAKAHAAFNVSELAALKIDVSKIISIFNPNEKKADVTFEEVTCVGLNPDTDTLGAVVWVKKNSGYSGDLCHKGSLEHVAFWADWDNDGTFDEYLGTQSFETHDIANIPATGLFYNVSLPINVSERLKSCKTPNIIKVRAVLSWEALPSTTDPNDLNTWGNSMDALVQLRPGKSKGLYTLISYVGNVDRLQIHASQHLYNYNSVAPTMANNRPWGGRVNFRGIIDRNGFNGVIKYRLSYKPFGAPDSAYLPVSHSETFSRWIPPAFPFNSPQTADPDGWYIYDVNPALGIFDNSSEGNLLANWQSNVVSDGTYTIRFEYTDEFGNPTVGDVFSIIICNQGMTISPTANVSVDLTKDLDLVIDGGDCHSYSNKDPEILGHLRAVHPYFAQWVLDLQPTSHTHGATPVPASRQYSAIGDTGADPSETWELNTKPLDPCGYTVSLWAYTRVILNSSGNFPQYGQKAVGFAKLP
ncbi:MAG TPA: hypothetical protein VFO76_11445 [Candidatus Kapabacteria bacterium]|nr:hypothetical protein [Candidatus Kapabacteria bacterium]